MILQSEKAYPFIDGLENLDKTIAIQSSGWFKEFRLKSLSRFQKIAFPTAKDEEWKYVDLSPILERTYKVPVTSQFDAAAQLQAITDKSEHTLVFVNGVFARQFSNIDRLPKGVIVSLLPDALGIHKADIEKILSRYAPEQANKFSALNLAAANSGTFVKLTDKAVADKLIHIVHITDQPDCVTMPRTIIHLGKSSQASVLETHICYNPSVVYLTNALTDIFVGENATLRYYKAQTENLKSFHIGGTRVWQEANSNFEGFSFMVGGHITRNNLDVMISGEGASARLNGLYCVNGNQLVDNHSSVDHKVPNGVSNQLYKGVLNGSSRAIFNGKIFVRPVAQKTNSYQLNKNLLLGKDARVDTKPQLEIGADDVKCTHGATIGQLNEDEVFYLQSRAIQKHTAVKMLCQGFVDDIINTVIDESVRTKFHKLLEPTLASF